MNTDLVSMGLNGRIILPVNIRKKISMPKGGSFVVHVEDGQVRLEPIAHAIARAQAMLDEYVPEGIKLSEELSADRRAEVGR